MATLKTNYTDDVLNVSQNKLRKYQILNNDDGTISLIDVTDYTSVGSELTSNDINSITKQINSNTDKIGEADISAVGDGTTTGAISALNESLTVKNVTADFVATNLISFMALKSGNEIRIFFVGDTTKDFSLVTTKWKPKFPTEYLCLNYSAWNNAAGYQGVVSRIAKIDGTIVEYKASEGLLYSYMTPLCFIYYI